MTNTPMGTSVVRTVTPIVVGAVLTLALKAGVHLDSATVTELVGAVVTSAYYAAARYAETKWPAAGWLLGAATPPSYDTAKQESLGGI